MEKKADFDFYMFRIGSDIIMFPGAKLNTLYSISFTVGEANAILSFSHMAQEPANIRDATGYEIYFTKDFLNKETATLLEKLKLFKSELPMMMLTSRPQEWRVKEIFESLLDECTRTDSDRNEMIRTLLHELILFSQRLLTINTIQCQGAASNLQ